MATVWKKNFFNITKLTYNLSHWTSLYFIIHNCVLIHNSQTCIAINKVSFGLAILPFFYDSFIIELFFNKQRGTKLIEVVNWLYFVKTDFYMIPIILCQCKREWKVQRKNVKSIEPIYTWNVCENFESRIWRINWVLLLIFQICLF